MLCALFVPIVNSPPGTHFMPAGAGPGGLTTAAAVRDAAGGAAMTETCADRPAYRAVATPAATRRRTPTAIQIADLPPRRDEPASRGDGCPRRLRCVIAGTLSLGWSGSRGNADSAGADRSADVR